MRVEYDMRRIRTESILTYRREDISLLLCFLVESGRAIKIELDGAQISVENVKLWVRR